MEEITEDKSDISTFQWNLTDTTTNTQYTPRIFNGKSQLQIVQEIIEAFKKHRIVLLEGACGTGKSSIALNVIKALRGIGIITVPVINLQKQYKKDYDGRMKVHDLNVGFILGKGNFECKFGFSKFDNKMPCKRQLKKGESRLDAGLICPYWSPRYQSLNDNVRKRLLANSRTEDVYVACSGDMSVYSSDNPCSYFEQFRQYIDKDVIVLNDALWLTETLMRRKPVVDIEIFDEYDCFFDRLTTDLVISEMTINKLPPKRDSTSKKYTIEEIDVGDESSVIITTKELEERKNKVMDGLLKIFVNKTMFTEDNIHDFIVEQYQSYMNLCVKIDEELEYEIKNILEKLNFYIENWDKVCVDFSKDSYDKREIRLGLAYPDIMLKKLFDLDVTAPRILLMSGTPHSTYVLKELFGLDVYVVKSNSKIPGTVNLMQSQWVNVSNKSWQISDTQKKYYDTMHDIITKACKNNEKILVQTPAKKYITPIINDERYKDRILYDGYTSDGINSNELLNWVNDYDTNKNILISTRTSRGIDLKDNLCRHIIITKCPYPFYMAPNIQALRKRFGESGTFNHIYNDMTSRELLQQVARGTRHENDWVNIWTPDNMVVQKLFELQNYFTKLNVVKWCNQ